jgi:hypothetical protein
MPNRAPRRIGALAVVSALALGGSATGIAYAADANITTTDAVVATTGATFLSVSGGVNSTLSSLNLPAGNWVIHTDDTSVGLNQIADVVRCGIQISGASDFHATEVGNASSYPLAATVSATLGIKLTAPATVTNVCSHDNNTGGTYYIDPGAVMSAHKAQSLKVATTP